MLMSTVTWPWRLLALEKFHQWPTLTICVKFYTFVTICMITLFSWPNSPHYIVLKIYKLELLWVPNIVALGIYSIFGTKFSWNEGIDTCFHAKCVLLGRNFDFFCTYLVVNALYVVVTARYWWFLLVTARYCSFPLLVWTHIYWRNP